MAADVANPRRAVPSPGDPGEAIFLGTTPVVARIRDHESRLPPEVVRCGNCHSLGEGAADPKANTVKLGRALLVEQRIRRGGPPSAYDESSFCRVLRTGVDPAYILVARSMPTYDVTDQQCRHLWRFLTTPAAAAAAAGRR